MFFTVHDEINEVANLGTLLPGQGFSNMRLEDINQLVFESHTVELTEEELKELVENNYEEQLFWTKLIIIFHHHSSLSFMI